MLMNYSLFNSLCEGLEGFSYAVRCRILFTLLFHMVIIHQSPVPNTERNSCSIPIHCYLPIPTHLCKNLSCTVSQTRYVKNNCIRECYLSQVATSRAQVGLLRLNLEYSFWDMFSLLPLKMMTH